ncbi:MAG: homoserine O-acetyltransferase [Gammaproteobacteria bacterium]|nr:homoserine O-acetyltransferase [Gammaproteobacteria bacterium]
MNTETSVGIVTPKVMKIQEKLVLESGKTLDSFEITFEVYGNLNKEKTNAVLICHALSGNHHVAGYHDGEKNPGWWDNMIGPKKPIDTENFFVVSLNNLGGCHGSTGPRSIDPKTKKFFGSGFPIVTVGDWVNVQKILMDYLKIPYWQIVVGGSLGGMQSFQWAIQYPALIKNSIIIAAAPRLTAQNIAFNEVARQAIMKDPNWHGGNYLEKNVSPEQGLALARMLGHITYLSDESMGEKFGRDLKKSKLGFDFDVEFQIESYLRYQGEKFGSSFDANTYLLMTKALDYYDPLKDFGQKFHQKLKETYCKFLVISFTSDWRFPPERSREIVKMLLQSEKNVSYSEIISDGGHDAFLMENKDYFHIMKLFTDEVFNNV